MVSTPSLTLAFAAGFVSFVSPCCLPLVPGFLATVGGGATSRALVVTRSLCFVASFSLVFIVMGLSATLLGSLLVSNQQTLNTISGIVIVAMGVAFISSREPRSLARGLREGGLPWWARHVYSMLSRVAKAPPAVAVWFAAGYHTATQLPGGVTPAKDQANAASLMVAFEMILFAAAFVLAFIFLAIADGRAIGGG